MNNQLVTLFLQADNTLVRVNYLLQVDCTFRDNGEWMSCVIFLVYLPDVFERSITRHAGADEDATREVTAPGNEVDGRIEG